MATPLSALCASGAGRHEAALRESGLRLWSVALDDRATDLGAAEGVLSPDERERARRFVLVRDRQRYAVVRAALRGVLGACLETDPAALRFRYGPHGKPSLDEALAPGLRFNVSHTEGLALIALARDMEVGVDVERLRPVPEMEGIAAQFFSPAEQQAIRSGKGAPPVEHFFRHWVLKEAWLKGRGQGLSGPLTDVEVARGDAGEPVLRQRATGEHLPWTLFEWAPRPGVVAALALARQLSSMS